MVYREEKKDLFSVESKYYFAQCISADFGMSGGIALDFNKYFNMKNKITALYPNYLEDWQEKNKEIADFGDCILLDRVLNLITKERCYHRPTYSSLKAALKAMKELCIKNNIKYVAMPYIGCGIDRLEWQAVSPIIRQVFEDTDIEILVCYI